MTGGGTCATAGDAEADAAGWVGDGAARSVRSGTGVVGEGVTPVLGAAAELDTAAAGVRDGDADAWLVEANCPVPGSAGPGTV